MIRRAVFALALIGSAFAGGAAINGPGLAWVQRNIAGGRSILVDNAPGVVPPSRPKPFPAASPPPLKFPPTPARSPARKLEPPVELAQSDSPSLPESPATPAADLAPLPESAPSPAPMPPVDPAPMPKTDPAARPASMDSPSLSAASQDWNALRKRLKALGVSRYTIEGEADGRVRFSCVIPVDGLKAVGHHFEADGDDEFQAAEAALKRVALFRATAKD